MISPAVIRIRDSLIWSMWQLATMKSQPKANQDTNSHDMARLEGEIRAYTVALTVTVSKFSSDFGLMETYVRNAIRKMTEENPEVMAFEKSSMIFQDAIKHLPLQYLIF